VVEKTHVQLDEMLRHFMLIGFGALLGWIGATAYGVVNASWEVDTNGTLRFVLAILIVTFAHRTVDEIREWRLSKMSTDERLGFGAPVWETTRGMEPIAVGDAPMTADLDVPATGTPQPPQ
jgi:hypothetical protein